MLPRLLVVGLAVLLAGCGGQGPAPTGTSDSMTTTTDPTPPVPPPPVPPLPSMIALNVTMNACKGIQLAHTYPRGQNPGEPPANWPPATGGVGSDVFVAAFDCERINWGAFERPATMVLEYHTNLDPPTACREGEWERLAALASWWVNDRELADFLATAYGMPVRYGAVDMEEQSDGSTVTLTATWNTTGTEPSSMTSTEVRQGEGSLNYLTRLFWARGNGTAMLTLDRQATFSNLQPPVVQGVMNPPMLLSGLGLPVFAARGELMPEVVLQGDLALFEDYACERPLR